MESLKKDPLGREALHIRTWDSPPFFECVYILPRETALVKHFFIYFSRFLRNGFRQHSKSRLFTSPQLDDLVAEDCGVFEFHHAGSLTHLLFQPGNFTLPFYLGHFHAVLTADLCCGFGNFNQIPHRFDNGLGDDAVASL